MKIPLPCPFCGKIPRVSNGKVKCMNADCKVQPKIKAWYFAGYEADAIQDWNERA